MFFIPPDLTTFYDELFERTELTERWVLVQIPVLLIGAGFLSLAVEYTIFKKTRYIFSILLFSSSIIILFMSYEIAVIFQTIPILCCFATIGYLIVAYGYLAYKNPGELRTMAIYICGGLVLFFAAFVLNSQTITISATSTTRILETPTIIVPISAILGCYFLYKGYNKTIV